MSFVQKFPQREPLTPEQLKRLKLPVTITITGADKIEDKHILTLNDIVKKISQKYIPIRISAVTDTDKALREIVKYPEYHLPWKEFDEIEVKGKGSTFNTDECFEFAKRYFIGDFEKVNKFNRANYGKTARLLFGKNLKSPCQLLIVWSDDGAESYASVSSRIGVTGHAIRMASASGIPVINIQNSDSISRIDQFLENIYVQQPPAEATESTKQQTNYHDDDIPY